MIRQEIFFMLLAVVIVSGLQFVGSSDSSSDNELIRFYVKNRLYLEDYSRFGYKNWCPGKIVSHPNSGKNICICQRGMGFDRTNAVSCKACDCGEGAITCSFYSPKKCYCESGYEIKDGKCIENVCSENPCLNNGTCWRSGDLKSFKCTCVPGYTGDTCGSEINPCESNICERGGTCWWRGGNIYWCECYPDFTGDRCEKIADGCYENLCLHNGTCWNGSRPPKCTCAPGYTGKKCEIEIDPCEHHSCYNGGTCYWREGNAYWCDCPSNYTGDLCETTVQGCIDGNPCSHGGTCYKQDVSDAMACLCPETHTGFFCENEINPCDPNPCENDGNCYRRTGLDYICLCREGFFGKDCSKKNSTTTPAPKSTPK